MNSLSRSYQGASCDMGDKICQAGNLSKRSLSLAQSFEEATEEIDVGVVLQWLTSMTKINKIQGSIFMDAWHGQTYQQTAEKNRYNYSYIKDSGHKLWRKLSALLDENITKHNCRTVVLAQYKKNSHRGLDVSLKTASNNIFDSVIVAKESPRLASRDFETDHRHAFHGFYGRGKELGTLMAWMALQRLRLIGVFGLAGCGKTMLVAKVVENVRKHFDRVIWRSLRDRPSINQFIHGILNHINHGNESGPDHDVSFLISQLINQLTKLRVLLVLDDWSSLFADHVVAGIYRTDTEKYGLLLRRLSESRHESCVVMTSRELPSGLVFKQCDHHQRSKTQALFIQGLNANSGYDLLVDYGLINGDFEACVPLLNYYSGNPYALRIAINTIRSLFGGDISSFLAQDNLIYGEIKSLLGAQFDRISTLEQEMLLSFSFDSQEFSFSQMMSQLSSVGSGERLEALESLLNRGFIQRQDEVFQIPTILRNYVMNDRAECIQ